MTLENINIINLKSNFPDDSGIGFNLNPEIGENVIRLTTSDTFGYYHYIDNDHYAPANFYFGDFDIIATDKSGNVSNYNLDINNDIPYYYNDEILGYALLKDIASGYFNGQEVLLELYAGSAYGGSGEIHVKVRDSKP